MSKFEKGKSGNPSGRPRGIVDKRRALSTLLEEHAEPLVKKAVDLALEGDSQALRLLIERILPKAKQDAIRLNFDGDEICNSATVTKLGHKVIASVCEGHLTPDEGKTIGSILEIQRKLIETNELNERVEALEYVLKQRKKGSKT